MCRVGARSQSAVDIILTVELHISISLQTRIRVRRVVWIQITFIAITVAQEDVLDAVVSFL